VSKLDALQAEARQQLEQQKQEQSQQRNEHGNATSAALQGLEAQLQALDGRLADLKADHGTKLRDADTGIAAVDARLTEAQCAV
jgi:DNA repair exonuclease SbcCD ATPase subunit